MKNRFRAPFTVEDGKIHVGVALSMAALTILFSGSLVLTAYAVTGMETSFSITPPAPTYQPFADLGILPNKTAIIAPDMTPLESVSTASMCPAPDVQQSQIQQMVSQLYEQCLLWGQQCNSGTCQQGDCTANCGRLAGNDVTLRARCLQTMCGQEVAPPTTEPVAPTQDCAYACKVKAGASVTQAFDYNGCLLECSGQTKAATSREACYTLCEEGARDCSLSGPNSAAQADICNAQYKTCVSKC